MAPTLELDVGRSAAEAVRETLRHWSNGLDRPGSDPAQLAEELGRLARSQARSRHELRDALLATVRRVAEDTSREHIDGINAFCQQLLDLRIEVCETLVRMAEKLRAAGFTVEGGQELNETVADYLRWKEDLPDELLFRHGPVRQRLAAAVEEGLRNPPAASNWQELFDD